MKQQYNFKEEAFDTYYKDISDHFIWDYKEKLVKDFIKEPCLEIGAGVNKRTYAIDFSMKALKFNKSINKIQGNALNLPFKNHVFNSVLLLDVLEHIDENKCLKEVYRVLRHEGKIVLIVPSIKSLYTIYFDKYFGHKKRYAKKELSILMTKHKFNILRITHFSFFIFPIVFIIRKFKELYKPCPLSELNKSFLNPILIKLYSFEYFLMNFFNLPIGVSLFAVGVK